MAICYIVQGRGLVVISSCGPFKGSKLVQMSDGAYCIIRDLGLVKGGKGLRHHENLLTLSVMGLISKLFPLSQRCARFRFRLPALSDLRHGNGSV